MADTFSITNIVQDILNIIKYYFKMEFDENSISYSRLLTHLKYFAQRVLSKKQSEDDNPPFYDQIKKNYKKYYDCALKIKEYISKNYDYEIGKEEIVYLCLHLQRVVNR
jgi:beta-glucoside operon transcriptional antiterminator